MRMPASGSFWIADLSELRNCASGSSSQHYRSNSSNSSTERRTTRMASSVSAPLSMGYLAVVLLLPFLLPAVAVVGDGGQQQHQADVSHSEAGCLGCMGASMNQQLQHKIRSTYQDHDYVGSGVLEPGAAAALTHHPLSNDVSDRAAEDSRLLITQQHAVASGRQLSQTSSRRCPATKWCRSNLTSCTRLFRERCLATCTLCAAPPSNGQPVCAGAGVCSVKCNQGFVARTVCVKGVCSQQCVRQQAACPAGTERLAAGARCTVCKSNFYRPKGSSSSKCITCPGGTNTVGAAAADHDSLEDCLPGEAPSIGCVAAAAHPLLFLKRGVLSVFVQGRQTALSSYVQQGGMCQLLLQILVAGTAIIDVCKH